jgi:hypothetical protein
MITTVELKFVKLKGGKMKKYTYFPLITLLVLLIPCLSFGKIVQLVSSPISFEGPRSFCFEVKEPVKSFGSYISLRFHQPATGQIIFDNNILNRFSNQISMQETIEMSSGKHTITILLESRADLNSLILNLPVSVREISCPNIKQESPSNQSTTNIEKRIEKIEARLTEIEKIIGGSKPDVSKTNDKKEVNDPQEQQKRKKEIEDIENFLIDQSRKLQELAKELKLLKDSIKK